MLGPLPLVYRFLVIVCAVASFIALGAWAAFVWPIPVVTTVATALGAGVTLYLLLHDFDAPSTHPARAQRRPQA